MSATHVFLTGPVQIGKSTLIEQALQALAPLRVGGFYTISAPPQPDGSRPVHLYPADEAVRLAGEGNCVGIRRASGITSFPAAFETAGLAALAGTQGCELLVMDEIGRMERDAQRYTARILELLDAAVPILGVVQRQADTPLACAVRAHPRVRLLHVTQDNRSTLLPTILSTLSTTPTSKPT